MPLHRDCSCAVGRSTVSEVSEESIKGYLATGKPAVVMVHGGSDLESTQVNSCNAGCALIANGLAAVKQMNVFCTVL